MIPLSLQDIAKVLGGQLLGEERTIAAVSSDSRQIPGDCLFVALKGERFDGHSFCAQAVADGAAALLVSEPLPVAVPQVVVPDTRYGLGQLGAMVRNRVAPKVIAITGSCGKTTVKEMCAAILSQRGSVLATQGNLNNEIGVPLTLLRLTPEHQFAVLELGANHPGEIAWTTSLARPDVALINNVAAAHLEGFGSLQGVALAKSEIFTGLVEQGVAVVNADSEFYSHWRADLEPNLISFGLENRRADVLARDIERDALGCHRFTLVTPLQIAKVMSGIVNGGKVITPRILASTQMTQERNLNIRENELAVILEGLKAVVEADRGTGRAIKDPRFTMGGKTGTVQVVRGYTSKLPDQSDLPYKIRDHAWFFGFSPVENPEILVVAIVEHGGSGSAIAAPVVRDVIHEYYVSKGVIDEQVCQDNR